MRGNRMSAEILLETAKRAHRMNQLTDDTSTHSLQKEQYIGGLVSNLFEEISAYFDYLKTPENQRETPIKYLLNQSSIRPDALFDALRDMDQLYKAAVVLQVALSAPRSEDNCVDNLQLPALTDFPGDHLLRREIVFVLLGINLGSEINLESRFSVSDQARLAQAGLTSDVVKGFDDRFKVNELLMFAGAKISSDIANQCPRQLLVKDFVSLLNDHSVPLNFILKAVSDGAIRAEGILYTYQNQEVGRCGALDLDDSRPVANTFSEDGKDSEPDRFGMIQM